MDKQEIIDNLNSRAYYDGNISGIKWNGSGQGKALCPFHDDQKESLSVKDTGEFFCHACHNKGGDIIAFHMLKHSMSFKEAIEDLARIARPSVIKKVYDYKDLDGNLIFQTIRYQPKDFKQRRPDPNNKGKWLYNLQGVSLIPFNLPEVINADTVFIVEGERDAETLKELGLVASCNPMGAGKWRPEFNSYFEGKRVYIITDNDKPGRDHALQVVKSLQGVAASVKVVELPGLKEKGDVSDFLAQGGTKEGLLKIIEDTPEWTEPKPKSLLESLLKWNDILSLDVRIEYLVDGLIPKGSITLLFGRGGIGKTTLMTQIAKAVANGTPFDTLQTIKTPVYYIDFENPLAVLKERVEKIGQSDNLYVWHISNKIIQPPKLDGSEWELYKQLPAGLLIVDTLRASHLSDENDSKPMSLIMGRLKELREAGFTIIPLQHTPKGNENTYKGSTALLDLCDHVLGLEEVKGQEGENIEFDTENLYKLGTRIKTRYEPHSIYLTFKPEIKGFEVAKDPDLEKLRDIWEVLNDKKLTPNQTAFRELIKKELDYTDHEVRRLIRKGEGTHWQKTKSGEGKGHKAFCYVVMSDPYIAHTTTQQHKGLDITSSKDTPKPLDNSHLLLCQKGAYHNNITSEKTSENISGAYHNKTDDFDRCSDCMLTPKMRELCEVKRPCPKATTVFAV